LRFLEKNLPPQIPDFFRKVGISPESAGRLFGGNLLRFWDLPDTQHLTPAHFSFCLFPFAFHLANPDCKIQNGIEAKWEEHLAAFIALFKGVRYSEGALHHSVLYTPYLTQVETAVSQVSFRRIAGF
jgi:hypothetical protein